MAVLQISQYNVFEEKGYYTWMYAGNMMWSNIGTGVIIALVIGFTLLPIWPDYAKKMLWYCSVTFLICTLSFCTIRLVAFLLLWVVGYDFWIFPRLFDESLSFQDSFKPIVSFERAPGGQGYYRVATLAALAGFVYWAYTQPSEFDGFLTAQKEFVDDLYSGKLLSDVAFDPKEHMKQQGKKVPNLEDLLKELEKDEMSISDKAEEGTGESSTGSDGLHGDTGMNEKFQHFEAGEEEVNDLDHDDVHVDDEDNENDRHDDSL
jgi:translocation protein SEC62